MSHYFLQGKQIKLYFAKELIIVLFADIDN